MEKRHSVGSQRMVAESSAMKLTEVNKWKIEVLDPMLRKNPREDVLTMD